MQDDFGGKDGIVLIGHRDEGAVRASYARHLPMSTSILAFHRLARDEARPAGADPRAPRLARRRGRPRARRASTASASSSARGPTSACRCATTSSSTRRPGLCRCNRRHRFARASRLGASRHVHAVMAAGRSETLSEPPTRPTQLQGFQRGRNLLGRFRPCATAERAGFEPATRLSTRTRFPVALLRPLGHLSGRAKGIRGRLALRGGDHVRGDVLDLLLVELTLERGHHARCRS